MANKYIQAYATEAAYNAASKPSPNVSLVYGTDKLYYNGDEHQLPTDYSTKYLTFKVLSDGIIKLNLPSSSGLYYYYYSVNGGTFVQQDFYSTGITLSTDDIVMFYGNIVPSANGVGTFTSTANFEAYGNPLSLSYGDDFVDKTLYYHQCYKLFSGCTSLTSAENLFLTATTLAEGCYGNMFRGCTSLTKVPELPATTLAYGCYSYMFAGCTSLTTAPQLPATTLESFCYERMFDGCTSLNSVTCLATSNVNTTNLTTWLNNVSATGTFTKKAGVTWPSGASGIPSGWTVVEQ